MPARLTSLTLVPAGRATAPPLAAGAARGWRRAAWILLPLGCLVAFAGALLHSSGEQRALLRLPPAERAALYHRTLDTLRSVCADDARQELRDLCRGQAELVLLLPECDVACQATAREQLRTPTR